MNLKDFVRSDTETNTTREVEFTRKDMVVDGPLADGL